MFAFKIKLISNVTFYRSILFVGKRYKSQKNKKVSCVKALNHFDDFYQCIFKEKWPSVRLALLSRGKTVAVINNLGDVEKTEELLKKEGAIDLRLFLESKKTKHSSLQNDYLHTEFEKQFELENILKNKLKEEKEKEFNLIYPEVTNKSPEEILFRDENRSKIDNEPTDDKEVFDIDNSNTSLSSDLHEAEFDESRIILPDSASSSSLNDFVPTSELRGLHDYIPESEYYKFYPNKSDIPVTIEKELDLEFPKNLKVYTFCRGDFTSFPETERCSNGVLNFCEVDGSSILTILALNVKPGDAVLNICSHSSSTSLTAFNIFQTFRAKIFVCKENEDVESIFSQYLFDYSPTWKKMLLLTSHDFDGDTDNNLFDKILVEVPCTQDKNSLFEPENNLFSPLKLRDRIKLPEVQIDLLLKALQLVRPGGTVVYSTNSLSPVQNDGVVKEALKIMWNDAKTMFTVKDLSAALAHTTFLFNFGKDVGLKYGTLVVPFLPSNFGPRYICKIVKNEQ